MPGEMTAEIETAPEREYRCVSTGCNAVFLSPPVLYGGRDLLPSRRCPECVARWEASQGDAGMERQRLDAEWLHICPALYRESDPARIPSELVAAANRFDGCRWLGFAGKAGTGKTRAAYIALRRMHDAGKACHAITGTELRRLLSDLYADDQNDRADARLRFKTVRNCDVLLLDDLGKQRFTDSAQEDVFDLLERRSAHLRPIIWTTNSGAKELADRLSADRAGAIIRRLSEFSEIVKIQNDPARSA